MTKSLASLDFLFNLNQFFEVFMISIASYRFYSSALALLIFCAFPFVSFAENAKSRCAPENSVYSYSGDPDVGASFGRSAKLNGFLSDRFIEVKVKGMELYFIFDRGSARKISLISSRDPERFDVPTPDGGVRPYGEMTYFSWDSNLHVNEDILGNSAPNFFVIPELAEKLARSEEPVNIRAGIFELHCKK